MSYVGPDGDFDDVYVTEQELIDRYGIVKLFAWGNNTNYQLGLNTLAGNHRSSPVQVLSPDWTSVWKSVRAATNHTIALKGDGTLWAWGKSHSYGHFANSEVGTDKSSPIQVGTNTNWKQFDTYDTHTLAIKTDGTLWGWGRNDYGCLADNTNAHRSSPVQIYGGGDTWKQVAAGSSHSAAVKTDGTLWTWGSGASGCLGDNVNGGYRSSPFQVVGTTWRQVTCGTDMTASIRNDGSLWTWGINTNGQLGDNSTAKRSSPVQIAGGGTWNIVSCGKSNSTGIKTDNTLWVWGSNSYGVLGIFQAQTAARSSPVQTTIAGSDWKDVLCQSDTTVALKTTGHVWIWGNGSYGRFGDSTSGYRSSPIQLIGQNTWSSIGIGMDQVYGITINDLV